MDGHAVSPFNLSRTLPVGGGLLFLIRISRHKATHANSYYGVWPGWAVSISVLPLTELDIVEQYERLPYGTLPFIIHTRTLLRMQGGTINNYAEKTSMLGF